MDINTVKSNFIKRGFNFEYFEDGKSAIDFLNNLIPAQSKIGFGGSQTVMQLDLLNELKNDYTLLHTDLFPDITRDELDIISHSQADWYICSSNAVSTTGDLINIDSRANRVGATICGPKNIVFICGTNKLVDNINDGIDRVRNVATPTNCKRLNKKTPCAVTNKCSYCNSPDTICKTTVILHHPTNNRNVYIIMINKNLGY